MNVGLHDRDGGMHHQLTSSFVLTRGHMHNMPLRNEPTHQVASDKTSTANHEYAHVVLLP
jgi:hypothetical protein